MAPETLGNSIIIKGPGRQKVFPPVGKCIYCGSVTPPLSEEHIIAFALGGNMILPKASCDSCRVITGRIEQILLDEKNGIFGPARLRLNLPTRRRHERPDSLEYEFKDRSDVTRIVTVKAGEIPFILHGYTTGLPGALIGRSPTEDCLGAPWTGYNTNHINAIMKPGESYSMNVPPDTLSLVARMIAKIAHSLAAAEYGIDSFSHNLPKFILGKSDMMFHYLVGGVESKQIHNHGMHFLSIGLWPPQNDQLVCIVKLFCRIPSPDYYVAVGLAGNSLRASLLSTSDNASSM